MGNFLEDVLGGVLATVANAADGTEMAVENADGGFVKGVLDKVPAALALAQQNLAQENQPKHDTSTSSPYNAVILNLKDDVYYTTGGKTIYASGAALLYRREGSNFSGAIQITFPSGQINIIRPGVRLVVPFTSFNVKALSDQFDSGFDSDQDCLASLLCFSNIEDNLFEPQIPFDQVYEPTELSTNTNMYNVRGLSQARFDILFLPNEPKSYRCCFYTVQPGAPSGDIQWIPQMDIVVDNSLGNGQGLFTHFVDVEPLQYIMVRVNNLVINAGQPSSLSQINAYGVQ